MEARRQPAHISSSTQVHTQLLILRYVEIYTVDNSKPLPKININIYDAATAALTTYKVPGPGEFTSTAASVRAQSHSSRFSCLAAGVISYYARAV